MSYYDDNDNAVDYGAQQYSYIEDDNDGRVDDPDYYPPSSAANSDDEGQYSAQSAQDNYGLSDHDIYSLYNIKFGKKVGDGAYGDVYYGRLLDNVSQSGRRYPSELAIKTIAKKRVNGRDAQKQLRLEINVHKILDHPNILRFYGYEQDEKAIHFFLEWAPQGNLYDYCRKRRDRLPEDVIADLLYQTGIALAFVHSCGIVHRDIKPENVLLDKLGVPKLTDFGYCDKVDDYENCQHEVFCGTTDYLAPEMIENQPCSYPIDVWAFGVMIFDLVLGFPPFKGKSHKDTYSRIVNCAVPYHDPHVKKYARNFKPLLQRIFVRYPEDRPSMAEVLQDEWFMTN